MDSTHIGDHILQFHAVYLNEPNRPSLKIVINLELREAGAFDYFGF